MTPPLTPPDPDAPIDLPPELQAQLTSGGILTTYWPAILFVIAAIGILVWWWLKRKKGKHPVVRGSIMIGSSAIVLFLAVALGVNTWVGYVPSFEAAGRLAGRFIGVIDAQAGAEEKPLDPNAPTVSGEARAAGRVTTDNEGGVVEVSVPSTSAGVPDSPTWVYLPKDYDKPGNSERYPVYYLLPGAPGTGADWTSGGNLEATMNLLISSGYLPPVIVVMPDLNAGDYQDREAVNYPNGGPQIEDFTNNDVVAYADKTYRTVADRQHRVIGGMSAGGMSALDYGLHREDEYGAIVAIMAYTEPYTEELISDPASLANYEPLNLIANAKFDQPMPVYLAQGDRNLMDDNVAIERALKDRGQPVTLQIFAGQVHNWTMARESIPYGLIWAARQLEWTPPGSPTVTPTP